MEEAERIARFEHKSEKEGVSELYHTCLTSVM